MDTKPINEIILGTAEDETVLTGIIKPLNEMYSSYLSVLEKYAAQLFENKNWHCLNSDSVIYDNRIASIYPNPERWPLPKATREQYLQNNGSPALLNFFKFPGSLMTIAEMDKCLVEDDSRVTDIAPNGELCVHTSSDYIAQIAYKGKDGIGFYDINIKQPVNMQEGYCLPVYRFNGINGSPLNAVQVMKELIRYNLKPGGISESISKVFDGIHTLIEEWEGSIEIAVNDNKLIIQVSGDFAGCVRFSADNSLVSNSVENLRTSLLESELRRANIDAYDSRILEDPNRGHWDLWEVPEPDSGYFALELDRSIMARNPAADIKADGVVGIDFGTKSTVVVCQVNNDPLPMRIGSGKYDKDIDMSQYENPTVMEFVSINRFMNKYTEGKGRPNTEWADMTVSHTANEQHENCPSDKFYAYFSELKQWAGEQSRQIRIIDYDGRDMVLPPFHTISENEFNPIEIYAYYLGLHINNMKNGIFLDYLLSYPSTYSTEAKEKIRQSFERGIKKTLPISIQNDESIMRNFRLEFGASEPAAYAAIALTTYEMLDSYSSVLETGERVYHYGVFDFGGGTTDFDFGIWRETTGKDSKRYDYIIEHFGASGDRYLGGENLLELLAFEVFKKNEKKMRENNLSFTIPPECTRFPGSEALLTESQEAKRNMRILMETLRPVWERRENYHASFESGVVKIDLFTRDGELKSGVELDVNLDHLENIIRKRITDGVIKFFAALKQNFDTQDNKNLRHICIFLAGNSSKSQILHEVFDSEIAALTKDMHEKGYISSPDANYFTIFPPLGISNDSDNSEPYNSLENAIKNPNGKTGVAFGLLKSRKGGKIKVINRNIEDGKPRFKFYIGHDRKGKFDKVISGFDGYNKWISFIDAAETDFEIYYTTAPDADGPNLSITNTRRKKLRISETDEDADVYIRLTGPSEIQYAVATQAEKDQGKMRDINAVILEE